MCPMRACYSGGTIVAASSLYAVYCAQTERIIIDRVEWRICKRVSGAVDDWAYSVQSRTIISWTLPSGSGSATTRNAVLGKRLAMTGAYLQKT